MLPWVAYELDKMLAQRQSMEKIFEWFCYLEGCYGAINRDRGYAHPRIPQFDIPILSSRYANFRYMISVLFFLPILIKNIVVKLSSTSNFCLTGIANMQYRSLVTYFPRDVSVARIGQGRKVRLEKNPALVGFHAGGLYEKSQDINGKPIGYVIHAHCWALLQQTWGATFGQTQLQKFIRAAQRYWSSNKLWGIIDDGGYNFYLWYHKGLLGSNVQHSPLIIPEIQTAIEHAQNIKPSGTYFDLPLELKMMIVEVAYPQDARNMLLAFGWILPESFWKSRFSIDDHLLFEMKSFKETSFAKWQAIGLDLVSVLQNKQEFWLSGLANRERVLKIIDSILGDMQKGSSRAE